MTPGRNKICLAASLLGILALSAVQSQGRGEPAAADRIRIDLPRPVTNADESYFDVVGRMALLKRAEDPMLVQIRDELAMGLSCQQVKGLTVLDGEVALPSFHEGPKEWKLLAEPFEKLDQAMSNLAGAWIASGDRYYANCLIDILEKWAKEDALSQFQFSPDRPRTWYALESIIFSLALAYSTVTGHVDIPPESRKTIDEWLVKVAQHHFKVQAAMRSCCDEHFYRRSLYMAIVGVVTGNDALFNTGLKAVQMALHDLNEQGALNFAVRRGWRAIYFQNDVLFHVVMIMQIASRQGYDLFGSKVNGRGFEDAVAFLMRSLRNPHAVEGLPPGEQDLTFTDDGRYFAWMEIWLTHFENAAMAQLVRHYRPISNEKAGGHITLYFKTLDSPRTAMKQELQKVEGIEMDDAGFGARYPLLKRWKRP